MRKHRIVELVNESEHISAEKLAQDLNVSIETIRRDLKALDKAGRIVRVHGGAIPIVNKLNDIGTSFINRASSNIKDKTLLVSLAIEELKEGVVIGLDASTSSWLFAVSMPDIQCTVVTNSINVIMSLESKKNISIISLGGTYSEKYKAFYGKITKETLEGISLNLCVISCDGFDPETGVWDSNEYNYEVKKKLVSVSEKTILIADKSKYNKKSLLKICSLEDVSLLITDAEIAKEFLGSKIKRLKQPNENI